jgi:hypothetical protein
MPKPQAIHLGVDPNDKVTCKNVQKLWKNYYKNFISTLFDAKLQRIKPFLFVKSFDAKLQILNRLIFATLSIILVTQD